jgi:carbon storage regulator
MLVLTRKVGERVIIEDGIRVEVLEVRGNRVRLGFTAPDRVLIRREELCLQVPESDHAGRLGHLACGAFIQAALIQV